MPIPIFITYFSDAILQEKFVSLVVGSLPFSITSPYTALMYAVCVVYLPFSLKLMLKVVLGTVPDNVQPRKQDEILKATNKMYARLAAAECNQFEGFPLFASAVLSANQAGVASSIVCMYATFWLLMRILYTIIYSIQINIPLSILRTITFGVSLATVGKLFALAAAV